MIAKQLTQNSWMITSDYGNNIGLVFKREDQLISTHNQEFTYNSLEEISKEFKEKLKIKEYEPIIKITQVKGYPIKHDIVFEIEDTEYPVYKTKKDSNISFVAGYWAIPFAGGARVSLSPKLTTIKSTDCVGPFKEKLEANVAMNQMIKK